MRAYLTAVETEREPDAFCAFARWRPISVCACFPSAHDLLATKHAWECHLSCWRDM